MLHINEAEARKFLTRMIRQQELDAEKAAKEE